LRENQYSLTIINIETLDINNSDLRTDGYKAEIML